MFTAERIIAKSDDVRVFNKANLMTEIDKVKKMLMNKIKTNQGNTIGRYLLVTLVIAYSS